MSSLSRTFSSRGLSTLALSCPQRLHLSRTRTSATCYHCARPCAKYVTRVSSSLSRGHPRSQVRLVRHRRTTTLRSQINQVP